MTRAAASTGGRRIFISYRRFDATHAARDLHERLGEHFGEDCVFRDIDDLAVGTDFEEVIRRELKTCGAVVAVISRSWLRPWNDVRMEIAYALARRTYVVPVLIDGTDLPRASDLPDDLKRLLRRNALELTDPHWNEDIARLIGALEEVLGRTPWWRSRPFPLGVWALAAAAAVYAQYLFAFRPRPVELAETGLFSPVAVRRYDEELVIEGPALDSAEAVLLAYEGRAREFVDLAFERARLGEPTRVRHAAYGLDPPRQAASLRLDTLAPRAPPARPFTDAEVCRPLFDVRTAGGSGRPAALHLYQIEPPRAERVRQLYLRAPGGDLHVGIQRKKEVEVTAEGPGCRKRLTIGDAFTQTDTGAVIDLAVAEDGGWVHFSIHDATPGGAGELFWAPKLGDAWGRGGAAAVRASAVYVRPQGGGAPQVPRLAARAAAGGLLDIGGLEVGADLIRLGISGRGEVESAGRPYTAPHKRLAERPLFTALFAAADLALLAALVWLLLGLRRQPA